MTTLEDIRNHMLEYMSQDFEDDGEIYDEDGHCGNGMWNEIKSFWRNFKTDKDFIYVVTGQWASDDIDLNGGRSYILSHSEVTPLLFDYLYNTLNWSLEKYQNEIWNSLDLTDDIEELYDSVPVKRDLKIDSIIEEKPVDIWSSYNFKYDAQVKTNKILEDIYGEIKELDSTDPCSISEAVCKFSEESGEWIREINKTTGRKIRKESLEEIHGNIKEEAADTLQNLLLICSRFNITLDDLLKEVSKKNQKWKDQIPKRQSQKSTT
jgi:NTP pyrophosphatase (non-canonical NTP hydrolase)